ncbi:hypothetical protein BAUCODRAFT_332372 [Baudoinia panamericana UAMH 10762]|uniref:Uncharacterized protein n=1 Tax=Baudoinia panamericana (strain UAMH 10762) TaxID=717646 RepID=M2M339_BAUPA|nr:uncharacterized protein BAUCODRAFT_332372 [Baudoinia panamericana UAMH 10762]EMC90951.1 hypothetical protein BAUCODRAFT_332372 [Baudoinia panamericana UAMH 10762]
MGETSYRITLCGTNCLKDWPHFPQLIARAYFRKTSSSHFLPAPSVCGDISEPSHNAMTFGYATSAGAAKPSGTAPKDKLQLSKCHMCGQARTSSLRSTALCACFASQA